MTHIVESIGAWGVVTSPLQPRVRHPRAGDIVDFGENQGTYPFTQGKYGRIDSADWLGEEGLILVCCEMGSAFLFESGGVSISGGPFWSGPLSELEATGLLKLARYWNWGDNSPGAYQGVDYHFDRPVFRLKLQKERETDD